MTDTDTITCQLAPHKVGKAKKGDMAFILPNGKATTSRPIWPLPAFGTRWLGFVVGVKKKSIKVQVYGHAEYFLEPGSDLWF